MGEGAGCRGAVSVRVVGGGVGGPGLKPGGGEQRELIKWSGGAAVCGAELLDLGGVLDGVDIDSRRGR
ncbi:MAG: hypothetical protein U9N73_07345 [Candidatus Auribacterota bacterium]|nr:hypothetical protein [Candidatus Auribacterota bacterium]